MPAAVRIIDPYADLSTYKKIVAKYGGEYSFFDNLRMGGIGSPNMVYQSGLEAFDEVAQLDSPEIPLVNIALLKKGVIVRINKRQKLASAICLTEHIKHIHIQSFQLPHIEFNHEVTVGIISVEMGEHLLQLSIPAKNHASTIKFFEKPFFQGKSKATLLHEAPNEALRNKEIFFS